MNVLFVAGGFIVGFAVWRLVLYLQFRFVLRNLYWQHQPWHFFIACLVPACAWTTAFAVAATLERAKAE